MPKPNVSRQNAAEVYAYYREHQPNMALAKLGYLGMNALFRSHAHYSGDAQAQIKDLLADRTQLILASNHLTNKDQYIIASLANSQKLLKPLRGETVIPSKDSLFKNPLLRRGVDIMGAVPTFREPASNNKQGPSEATLLLTDTTDYLMNMRRKHLAIFPEGTRNKENPRHLQNLKRGVGFTACQASAAGIDLAFVPIGISYGYSELRPDVVIAEPLEGPFLDPVHTIGMLDVLMQEAVDEAFSFSDMRQR